MLGAIPLTKLKPVQISDAYTRALSSGRRDGKGGLAPTTVVYMHRLIKHALTQAVRWELLSRNPADAVSPPKVERTSLTTFDMAQTAELIEALRGTRLLIPVMLAVLCGLRRGEIVALRWRERRPSSRQDLRLSRARSRPRAASATSRRSREGAARSRCPASWSEELRAHRLRQAEEQLRLGLRQDEAGFVYTREDGEPMQPRSLTHAWQSAIGATEAPAHPVPRSPPRARDASARERRSPEGRFGTARALADRHHARSLLARAAGDAGGRGPAR